MRGLKRTVPLLLALVGLGVAELAGQQGPAGVVDRGPRFLLASVADAPPVRVEPGRVPLLRQRITVRLENVSRAAALEAIAAQSGIRLVYSGAVVPLESRVSLVAEGISVAAALTEVLLGTDVDVVISGGQAALVRRQPEPVQQEPGTIVGRVTDAGTGAPLLNAHVLVDGESRGFADEEGRYRITGVRSGRRTVTVTLIGYATHTGEVEVPAGGVVEYNVRLDVSPTRLSELVVTATGTQRRLEVGNDITVLNVDSILATERVTSVADLLEGRVPGLVVQRTSGAPGDPARLRLRGASSPLLSNDPIVIVDGARVYSAQSDERGANLAGGGTSPSAYAAPSPLDYIDPHSIETIQVIKGPSAATLYGQDAANGVIVVTTKRGRPGPAQWRVSAEYGATELPGTYPKLFARWGEEYGSSNRVFCPAIGLTNGGGVGCQADTLVTFQMLNDPDLSVLDRGHATGLTFGVSGGNAGLTYSVTGSYRNEVGLIALPAYEVERYRQNHQVDPPAWMRRPQRLERWSASSRMTARLGDKADVALTSTLSRTMQQRSSLERQLGVLMSTYFDRATGTYYVPENMAIRQAEDDRILRDYFERATADATQLMNAVTMNWRPFGWLTAGADAGLDLIHRTDEILLPRGLDDRAVWRDGLLSIGKGTSLVTTLNARVAARAPLGRGLQFELATGLNYSGQSVDDLVTEARGLVEGTESVNGAAEINSLDQRPIEQATFGWYVQPSINSRRLWLSTGVRFDGGSTFGSNLKLPLFPKVSASYLVSDEPFFPSALRSVFNTLRLRAAYGQAGRQPGPVDRLRLYGARHTVRIDDELIDVVVLERLGNTRLKPERSEEIEAGFDSDLFDDRLSVSFTFYRADTRDMILDVPVAPSVYGNAVSVRTNIGRVRNSGVEARLATQLVRSVPVTWNVELMFNQQRNEVLELGAGMEPFYTQTSGETGIRVAAGYPLFGRWTKPILGYADLNGDGVLVREEVILGDTAVYVGSTLPNYTATLYTSLSLLRGAVSVSAGVLYENGMTQRNEVARRLAPFSRAWNDPSASLEQQIATLWANTEYNWIQTINSLRLNSVSVTYHVPVQLARHVGAQALSVSLQGSNLALWTNYRGLDPHVNASVTGNDVTDSGVLPRPRTWQLRMNASY